MKSRKTWLLTAVRAQQALTMEQLQRAQHARDELSNAEQMVSNAAEKLRTLSEDWLRQRQAAPSSVELDGAYLRFHGFLQQEGAQARQVKEGRVASVEDAVTALKRSHAIQRTLEKVAKHAVDRQSREVRIRDAQDNAEAWLLGRIASFYVSVSAPTASIASRSQGLVAGPSQENVSRTPSSES